MNISLVQGSSKSRSMVMNFTGQSMRPLIVCGDQVRVDLFEKPLEYKPDWNGRVGLFYDGQEWVLHRFIELKGELFFKGDFSGFALPFKNHKVWGLAQELTTSSHLQVNLLGSAKYIRKVLSFSQRQMQSQGLLRKYYKARVFLLNIHWRFFLSVFAKKSKALPQK